MTSQRDPFEMVAALNPVVDRPLVAGEDPVADAILARIIPGKTTGAKVVSIDTARRRRYRWVAPVVVVGVLASGGAAAAWVMSRHQTEPFIAGCYRTARLTSDQVFVAVDGVTNPVDSCARSWLDGTFGTDGPPQLTACVTPEGAGVVVPGDDRICAGLGYVPYNLTPDREADAIRDTSDAIFAFIQADADTCVDLDSAKREYRKIADAHGLSDWPIIDTPFDAAMPCITANLDRANHNIGLPGVLPPG
jgi:hypothetical protein